jgi:hypothetical protein
LIEPPRPPRVALPTQLAPNFSTAANAMVSGYNIRQDVKLHIASFVPQPPFHDDAPPAKVNAHIATAN